MVKNINRMSTSWVVLLGLLVSLTCIVGCADNEALKECAHGHTYGFWGGLWHGIIAPFGFIGMLVSDSVAMYAPNNNGAWYAFGFLLGSGGWGFIGGRRS